MAVAADPATAAAGCPAMAAAAATAVAGHLAMAVAGRPGPAADTDCSRPPPCLVRRNDAVLVIQVYENFPDRSAADPEVRSAPISHLLVPDGIQAGSTVVRRLSCTSSACVQRGPARGAVPASDVFVTVDPANGQAFQRFCEELASREGDRAAGAPEIKAKSAGHAGRTSTYPIAVNDARILQAATTIRRWSQMKPPGWSRMEPS